MAPQELNQVWKVERARPLAVQMQAVEYFPQHTADAILMTKPVTSEGLGFYKHLLKAAHGQQTP